MASKSPFRVVITEEVAVARIKDIEELIKSDNQDKTTDYIYQNTDKDFNSGKFRIWQHVMEKMMPEALGSSVCRSLLVLTRPSIIIFDDEFHKVRKNFYNKVYDFLKETKGSDVADRLVANLK